MTEPLRDRLKTLEVSVKELQKRARVEGGEYRVEKLRPLQEE